MRGYLSTPISEHIEETPEGFLIARDCVIARTGFQTYAVKDLPQQSANDLGIDTSNPNAEIDLYRPASEVFHPDTLKSAEGKAVTYNHPPDFINPHNFNEYSRGHLQNVRRGTSQLDSGDMPMMADVLIMAEPLLSDVRNKRVRELSLGYDYSIARDGERINQTDMVINHLAVVPKGRAGPEARIMDAAPETLEVPVATPPEPAASPPEPSAGHVVIKPNAPTTVKEKRKVKNNLLHLFGLGLKAKAQEADVDPEELAQAAMEVSTYQTSKSDRARAADAAEEEEEKPAFLKDKKGKDKAKDAKAKDDLGDPPDEDVEPADDRKRLHDAFDAMLDRKGKDADIAELRQLMDEFLGEEEEEPEHAVADAGDVSELEKVIGEETDAAEPCPECGEMGDACVCDGEGEPGESLVESGEEELEPAAAANDGKAKDSGKAKDRARAADAVSGAKAVLKLIRPYVARSNDAGLRSTFNAALGSVTRSSRASNGSVAKFAGAARARDRAGKDPNPDRARVGDSEQDRNAKLQKAYDDARMGVTAAKGGK